MDPLAVTFDNNGNRYGQKVGSFVDSGYDHLHITQDGLRVLNKLDLIELGFPYYG